MERQLSMAKDRNDTTVNVERSGDVSGPFFCPRCRKEVVPRKGKEKAWHFYHKEGRCGKPLPSGINEDASKGVAKLSSFSADAIPHKDFQPSQDKGTRICARCHGSSVKDIMKQLEKGIFLCRECYMSIDRREMDEIIEKHS